MKKSIVSIAVLFISVTALRSQIINTVAGSGPGAYNGDNIQATAAELYTPCATSFDGSGNYYIADEQNNRIRKVDIGTGIITTIAGTGSPSYFGDNGAATAASMYWPAGVAIDGNGNIFISDQNNAVRRIDAVSGIITTVAGNGIAGFSGDGSQASAAEVHQPIGIAIDGSNNVYFADASNNRVRKINVSTGVITTIVGNGTAGFSGDGNPATAAELNFPYSVSFDAAGNLYVADQNNNRIRKVDLSGTITTIAGNGIAAYSGDGFQATTAELNAPKQICIGPGGDMIIADCQNNRVRKVFLSTGIITTVGGYGIGGFSGDTGPATAAELHFPNGVTTDSHGNLYITDWANNRVRMVTNVDPNTEGIASVTKNETITVYPNPANNLVNINLHVQSEKVIVSLFNMLGQDVYNQTCTNAATITIPVSNFQTGTYLLSIKTNDGKVLTKKIEIAR